METYFDEGQDDTSQTIAVQINGAYTLDTTHLVTLIVTNGFIPACDHLEVKVSRKGIIIERLDAQHARFINAYEVMFATDFNGVENDAYADESDGDDDTVSNEGGAVVPQP